MGRHSVEKISTRCEVESEERGRPVPGGKLSHGGWEGTLLTKGAKGEQRGTVSDTGSRACFLRDKGKAMD